MVKEPGEIHTISQIEFSGNGMLQGRPGTGPGAKLPAPADMHPPHKYNNPGIAQPRAFSFFA
jgi:hypothetical protein